MRPLLGKAVHWFLLIPFLLLCASPASAGKIAPELLEKLKSGAPGQEHAVIVKLSDQIDYSAVGAEAANESREGRLSRVVKAMRDRAEISHAPLRKHLATREREKKAKKVREFWIFNGFALTVTAELIQELAERSDVAEIVPDRVVTMAMPLPAVATAGSWNLDLIGAPTLWPQGFTGQGAVVASLDTGVDIGSTSLGANWRGGANDWYDPYGIYATPHDNTSGHGTGTMGVMVAGADSAGIPIGVAPDAKWIAARIFDDNGDAFYSVIHQAFQWVLGLEAAAPDLVNCSWDLNNMGTVDPGEEFRPDIQALTGAGIAVVFAAGNSGPAANSSTSPANYPESFAAGATDSSDSVAWFSSRGPSAFAGSIYPAVTAPGVNIRTTHFGGFHVPYSGTSFAAPHVAGAVALLLNKTGTLQPTVPEIEAALKNGAVDLGAQGPDNDYGYGRLDIVQAAANLGLITLSPPDGDLNVDGRVNVADALIALRAAAGLIPKSPGIMQHGDVGPQGNGGMPEPDRRIEVSDALLILQKAVGLITW